MGTVSLTGRRTSYGPYHSLIMSLFCPTKKKKKDGIFKKISHVQRSELPQCSLFLSQCSSNCQWRSTECRV